MIRTSTLLSEVSTVAGTDQVVSVTRSFSVSLKLEVAAMLLFWPGVGE